MRRLNIIKQKVPETTARPRAYIGPRPSGQAPVSFDQLLELLEFSKVMAKGEPRKT